MHRRTQLVPLVLALLPLAACGSTVQGAASLTGAAGGDGLSAPVTTSTGSTTAPTTPAGTPQGTGSSAPGTVTQGVSPLPGSTAVGRSPSAVGPGSPVVTTDRTPVKVGLLYIDGAEAAAGNLGISGLATGDAVAQAKAVVAHLNANGGLAGRPIDLREGRMDAARAISDNEGTYSAACTSLTQDQKVSVVVSYVNLTESKLACYAKAGVTVLDDQSAVADKAGTKYAGTFAGPGELALGRAADELVDALWRRGWLNAKSKVGTLVPDTPDGAEVETRHLLPALARHGLTPAGKARATGAAASKQNAIVLQFRNAGVDRVIPMGQSPLFLMQAAESQGYRPAYAMNSGFGPGALLESAAPKGQLTNAAGIGWSKFLDIGTGTRPGPVSTNETLCFALMKKAGQQSTDPTTQAFQASLCNVLMFIDAAAERYGVVPQLLELVRSQGLDFPPADAFGIAMRPGRADGVSAYRDVVYDSGCSCFQYVGGNRPTD